MPVELKLESVLQAASAPLPKAERRHDIDALRVLGTLLVFGFHSLQPFNPRDQWHLQNDVKSAAVGYFLAFLNIWVMPLFMLLAGASTYYAMKTRTNRQFLKERFRRIFVPLQVGILLVVPPQVYWQRLREGKFTGSFLDFYPHFFDGTYPTGNFSWHHLWFLAYLFTYAVVGLGVLRMLRTDRLARLCGRRPLALLLLPALPLAALHDALFWNFPQTNALWGDWGWHGQLFTVFVYGYVLVSDERFGAATLRVWRPALALGVVCAVLVLTLPMPFALRGAIYRLGTWTWLLAILGLARVYLSRPRRIFQRAAPAAFPFYIVHQTLIVGAAFYVLPLDLPIPVKLTAIVALALPGAALAGYGLRNIV